MKRFSEQFKKKSENIRLTVLEKRDLRERLVSYMEYHPLPVSLTKTKFQPATEMITDKFKVFYISTKYLKGVTILATIFVFIIMPSLAERTVPGDILYPVKGLTEDIRGSLNFTPYEKVAWETKRLERRVAEARLLVKEGKLTPQMETDFLVAVQAHKSAAEAQIKSLETTDAEGAGLAQITFSSVLDVQSAVLRSDSSSVNATTSDTLSGAIANVLEDNNENTGKDGQTVVSFERLMAQLEIETTRVYDLFASNQSIATASEIADAKRRLTDIELKINNASDKYQETPDVVIEELRTALGDLQKLIAFMTDINVRESVSIESLVPIVLTTEEHQEVFAQNYEKLEADLLILKNGQEKITDTAVIDKIENTLPEVQALIARATSSMTSALFNEADFALASAQELVNSMLSMSGIGDGVIVTGATDRLDTINSTTSSSTELNMETEIKNDVNNTKNPSSTTAVISSQTVI